MIGENAAEMIVMDHGVKLKSSLESIHPTPRGLAAVKVIAWSILVVDEQTRCR
jgi:hypothetical protein